MNGLTNQIVLVPKVGMAHIIKFKFYGLPSELVKHLYGDLKSDGKPNGKQPFRNGKITDSNGVIYVPVHYLPTADEFRKYSNFSNVVA